MGNNSLADLINKNVQMGCGWTTVRATRSCPDRTH